MIRPVSYKNCKTRALRSPSNLGSTLSVCHLARLLTSSPPSDRRNGLSLSFNSRTI
jgi:hypothetical protein